MKTTKTNASAVAHHTTAPVQPGAEWLRVSDVTKLFRISRSLTYELIKEGKLRSVCLRRKNRQSGIRLIATDSVRAYIASFEESPE
jgi:hypothetical protein